MIIALSLFLLVLLCLSMLPSRPGPGRLAWTGALVIALAALVSRLLP